MVQARNRWTAGRVAWRGGIAWLAAALMWLSSVPAGGQQLSPRNYGQLDGLGNLVVLALAQDGAGYIWVGTENGLYRFDGNRFQRIDKNLGYASIAGLHVDPAGRLWVAARQGLFLLDGERLLPVPRADGGALRVWSGQQFASAEAGNLLALSEGKLQRVRPDGQGGWHGVPFFHPAQIAAQPGMADITAVLRDPDGTLWMACGRALCRYRDGVLTVLGQAHGLPPQRWYALRRDAAGRLWVGASNRLMVLSADGQRFSDRTPEHFGAAQTAWPTPLVLDGGGALISVTDNGLFRLGAKGWEHFGPHQGLRVGSDLHALLLDRQGDLWLGVPGHGLLQWRGYRRWENWTREQGLPHDDVWSLLRSRDGVLHVGTGAGLALQDGGRFAMAADAVGKTHRWGGLAEDGHGDVWAGSGGWLVRRDRRSGRERVVARLPVTFIYRLLFDDAGRLWICTARGLYLIDDPDGKPEARLVDAAASLLGGKAEFSSACRDTAGRLWFATDKGLLRLDRNGAWSRPLAARGDDFYRHVACDGDTLWLGDFAQLWRADVAAPQLQPRRFEHKVLEGRSLVSLLVDRRHWLWLGTDSGLMAWNGRHWRLFDQQSGMVWNDSNQNALMEDRDGSIWVGTSKGASRLPRPEELFAPQTIPLRLASLRYGDAPLAGAVAPWSGAALDAQVAAPVHQNHETLSYRYRLVGQEEKWSTRR